MASTAFRLPFEQPIFEIAEQIEDLEATEPKTPEMRDRIRGLRKQLTETTKSIYNNLDPWETVRVARHPHRPMFTDYLNLVFDEFVELHGDKTFGDDRALITGFAKLGDWKVMLVAQCKGRNLQERNECSYGCAHPEGYRKAMSKMSLAAKFGLPIICLIDTPGAYPGIGAEERGQAYTIAVNLRDMSRLQTPIICVVIGEGGSGGALGIGIGDHIAVLQFAYYSVISPEGCAAILWKDGERTPDAAEALRLTAGDLTELGLIDGTIPEPLGGAHRDRKMAFENLGRAIVERLDELCAIPLDELVRQRREKYRKIGWIEGRFPEVE